MTTKNSGASQEVSYIQWSAILSGAAVALAITLILIPFGNAVGLSIATPLTNEKARGMVFGIGLWIFWTQLISSIFGGYFAGKCVGNISSQHNHESEFRDGTHGLLAWSVATILTAIGIGATSLIAALAPHHANDAVITAPELAKRAGIVFSFSVAASSVVSGAAAWWFATIGGDHRVNSIDLSGHLFFRKAKSRR